MLRAVSDTTCLKTRVSRSRRALAARIRPCLLDLRRHRRRRLRAASRLPRRGRVWEDPHVRRVLGLMLAAAGLLLIPAATATPPPSTVTVAGSLQSEAGCPGDWDPACATTHLVYDASDDVWQKTFALP